MSDWETEFDAWWADYLGPRTPRASGEAAWAEMWNRSEDQLASRYAVVEAANWLDKEVHGVLGAFEIELREVISNTNYACLRDRQMALRAALAAHERITKTEKDS